MNITIKINTSNATFEADQFGEVGRILRELADKIEDGEIYPKSLRDINGNTCGTYHLKGY